MSNKVKPPQSVIDYFAALGFEHKVIEDSVFMDKRDAPVHFFQPGFADGVVMCSTILADDAVKIFDNVAEPFSRKVDKTFGERCKNGHLRSVQPCRDCKPPDGRSRDGRAMVGTEGGKDEVQ